MPHSSFAAVVRTGGRRLQARGKPGSPGALRKICLREGSSSAPRHPRKHGNPGRRPSESASKPLSASEILSGAPRLRLSSPSAFLFDTPSLGNPQPARIAAFRSTQNRTNPKRRPSKIRYAEPLACQGARAHMGRASHPTNVVGTRPVGCRALPIPAF